jgi:hypothetical protein
MTKRRRIWEIGGNFHCSIIGTCMTTAELRHVLVHTQVGRCHKEPDHELHCKAAAPCGRRRRTTKQHCDWLAAFVDALRLKPRLVKD